MNTAIFLWLYGFAGRWVVFDWIVVFCADTLGYLWGAVLIVGVVANRRRFDSITQALAVAVTARILFARAIHMIWQMPRPFVVLEDVTPLVPASGWSFPSGHATFFFALAASLWVWNRKWGTVALGVAMVIGVARVIAGVHWPADILGGAVVGVSTASIVYFLTRKNRRASSAS